MPSYPPAPGATKGTEKNLYCFGVLWLDLKPGVNVCLVL